MQLLLVVDQDWNFNSHSKYLHHGIVTIVIALGIRWLWQAIVRRRRTVELVEKLPGPPLFWTWTNTKNSRMSMLLSSEFWLAHAKIFLDTVGTVPGYPNLPDSVTPLQRIANDCQDSGLFRFWMFAPQLPFSKVFIFIHDTHLARQFLTDPLILTKISKEKRIYDMSQPVVGHSFLTLPDGKEWKHQRKLTAVGFHQRFLEYASSAAVKLLEEKVFSAWDAALVNRQKQSCGRETTTNTITLEMAELCTRLILEILGHVAFSCSLIMQMEKKKACMK
jgi:hypothetical protein